MIDSVKNILSSISSEVDDIFETDFVFTKTASVPNVDDGGLTYANGNTKKGKELMTCVLFVDIRDSVRLLQESYTKTMGRVYTAFIKAVLRVAEACGGFVRNIIGDRVMVVFPETDCFKNAIDCAITINHVAKYIIDPKVNSHTFKCGIGVDYGKIRCIKVGVEKHGLENSDNKNLVWIGGPANYASRLCDFAGKEVRLFHVKHRVLKLAPFLNPMDTFLDYLNTFEEKTEIMSSEQIQKFINDGRFKSILSVNSDPNKHKHQPILISEAVFKGFSKVNPDDLSIKKGYWKIDSMPIKDISFSIYGADLHWEL